MYESILDFLFSELSFEGAVSSSSPNYLQPSRGSRIAKYSFSGWLDPIMIIENSLGRLTIKRSGFWWTNFEISREGEQPILVRSTISGLEFGYDGHLYHSKYSGGIGQFLFWYRGDEYRNAPVFKGWFKSQMLDKKYLFIINDDSLPEELIHYLIGLSYRALLIRSKK